MSTLTEGAEDAAAAAAAAATLRTTPAVPRVTPGRPGCGSAERRATSTSSNAASARGDSAEEEKARIISFRGYANAECGTLCGAKIRAARELQSRMKEEVSRLQV